MGASTRTRRGDSRVDSEGSFQPTSRPDPFPDLHPVYAPAPVSHRVHAATPAPTPLPVPPCPTDKASASAGVSPAPAPQPLCTPLLLRRAMELSSPHARTLAHTHASTPWEYRGPGAGPGPGPSTGAGTDAVRELRLGAEAEAGSVEDDDAVAAQIEEVEDEVLAASRLIRRCRRYFRKLLSTARISKAYRAIRRARVGWCKRRAYRDWRCRWRGWVQWPGK